MNKLFEASWRDGYNHFERVFNTITNKSEVIKINLPYEWYVESSNGLYSYILDESIKLEKKQGHAKEGRDEYGFLDPIYRNIRDNYWNKNGFNLKPRIWYVDIETRVGTGSSGFPSPELAAEPISLIQIFDNLNDTVIMLGVKDWKHQDSYDLEYPVKYINCKDEISLIKTFLELFKRANPLIIYAWNGAGFDFPYIYNRLANLGFDTNELSVFGNVTMTTKVNEGKTEFNFKSDGHFFMDLMDVYKKFVIKPRPSYALDTISEIELGENKVQHTEYASFDDFYTGKYIIPSNPTEEQLKSKIYIEATTNGGWQINDEVRELCHSEFCYYGYKDPLLIKKIDDKLNFTALMIMISEKMGVMLSDTLGTVKPWSQYISNKSMIDNKVMPPKKDNPQPNVVGGHVKDPIRGKHKYVLSADVNSMYPLLGMVGFNMSPETYVPKYKLPANLRDVVLTYFNDQDESKRFDLSKETWDFVNKELKEHNYALAINGAVFTRDKLGMIPEMVKEIYVSRKQAKKTQFKYEQRKILIGEIIKGKLNEHI